LRNGKIPVAFALKEDERMAMIKGTEIRPGMVLRVNGELYLVVKMEHVTPGKGRGIIQTKVKSLSKGNTFDMRFSPSDKVENTYLEMKEAEFLYTDSHYAVFMDLETYDNIEIPLDQVKEQLPFMPPNCTVKIRFIDESPIAVELPTAVELRVETAPPAVKGDTATNVSKIVKTETGLEVKTPAHIKEGDVIKVDTRTGEFVERVNR